MRSPMTNTTIIEQKEINFYRFCKVRNSKIYLGLLRRSKVDQKCDIIWTHHISLNVVSLLTNVKKKSWFQSIKMEWHFVRDWYTKTIVFGVDESYFMFNGTLQVMVSQWDFPLMLLLWWNLSWMTLSMKF